MKPDFALAHVCTREGGVGGGGRERGWGGGIERIASRNTCTSSSHSIDQGR